MTPDAFLLDRVAQPFADRFLRDDQAQRVAAFLLPGEWVISTARTALTEGSLSPWSLFGAFVGLLATGWFVWRIQAAGRVMERGFLNPLRDEWRWVRTVIFVVGALFCGVTALGWIVGLPPTLPDLAAVLRHLILSTALYLGSTNRPTGLHEGQRGLVGSEA